MGWLMRETLGYMITFTTYGTWLQGDKRGYVKNATIYPSNENLMRANKENQSGRTIRLSADQREIARKAVLAEAASQQQRILALSVASSHVHIVAEYIPKPIGAIVAYYKKATRLALKDVGHNGKLWTKGYDKRFCFDKATLDQKIHYVQSHNT